MAGLKRDTGYYWVKKDNNWMIGQYTWRDDWRLTDTGKWFIDKYFDDIDERRIERLEINSSCTIDSVSKQSELLKAFVAKFNEQETCAPPSFNDVDLFVKGFL